jgi:hypothetical protein
MSDCLCILGKGGDLGLLAQPKRSPIGLRPSWVQRGIEGKSRKHLDPLNRSAERRRKNLVGRTNGVGDRRCGLASRGGGPLLQMATGDVEARWPSSTADMANGFIALGCSSSATRAWPGRWFQETFVRLWRAAGRFDAEKCSVGTYLYVIVRSVAADIPSARRPVR